MNETLIGQYTLEQLAHFDRCLFPQSLAEDIARFDGIDKTDLEYFISHFRWIAKHEHGGLSAVSLYQRYINEKRFCEALDAVVSEFCQKHLPVTEPQPCWAVVDFEDNFIIVRHGKKFYDGNISAIDGDHIVPMKGFEASKMAWEAFNEWQFCKCPYPTKD